MSGSRKKATNEPKIFKDEQFRTLIEQSADAIQLVSPEGEVLYSSDSVVSVLGYTPEEIQNVNISPYLHPDDAGTFMVRWAELLKKHRSHDSLEYRVKHKDGSWVWVETTVTNHVNTPGIEAVVGNFRNITKRKATEEKLRQSEERFRFMAESMPQKIYTSTADGEVDYCNPQWLAYTGLKSDMLYGSGWTDIIHPEDREDSLTRWQHSIKTGIPFAFEQRFRRHDGKYRWHITRAVPMCDQDGAIIKWFGSNTDIHDIRLAMKREHALEKQAIKLIEQRTQLVAINEAKDEFIALASHQLRTPATAVKQYLGMVLGGFVGELTPAQRAMIVTANDSNERQIDIINDLLEVARLDAGKVVLRYEPADLCSLVAEVIDELATTIRNHDQRLKLLVPKQVITATIDPAKIRMVLENLISNASKYSLEDTTVGVAVSDKGGEVRIAIADQGVGIAKADQDKLFKKFSRLDNPLSVAVGGTGLGLYWAGRIVELHGGRIEVESDAGKGSTFTVVLPRR